MPQEYKPADEVEVTGKYMVIRDGTDTGDLIELRKGQKFPSRGLPSDKFRLIEGREEAVT